MGLPNLNMKEKRIEFCLVLVVKRRHRGLLCHCEQQVITSAYALGLLSRTSC